MLLLLAYTTYWQIKEYRWDRVRVDWQWPWQVVKRYRRPRLTGRSVFILGSGLLFALAGSLMIYGLVWGMRIAWLGIIIGYGLVEVLAPVGVSVAVLLSTPLVAWRYKRSYQAAAQVMRQVRASRQGGLKVVGITGSYGKTSVKEITATLAGSSLKVLKTPHNVNTAIGVSQLILRQLDTTFDLFVAELAAYKQGDIRTLARIVQPEIGVLTGLTSQHLALFGSFEKIKQTKFELIEALPKNGVAIFNFDDQAVRKLVPRVRDDVKVVSYGIEAEQTDVRAKNIKLTKTGSNFQLAIRGSAGQVAQTNTRVDLPLLGKANVLNFLAGAAVAIELGIPLSVIAQQAKKLQAPPGTLQLIDCRVSGLKLPVIDDSYNANPAGVRAALEVLAPYQGYTKIVIMPSLIELGRQAVVIHQRLSQAISQAADYLFVTDRRFEKPIRLGWQAGQHQLKIGLSAQEIFSEIQRLVRHGKVVILLEGRIPAPLKQILNPKS